MPVFFQEVFHDPSLKVRRPKQVFTGAGASGILINDLVRILGDRGQNGVEADTIQDNIFQWSVCLSHFQAALWNRNPNPNRRNRNFLASGTGTVTC